MALPLTLHPSSEGAASEAAPILPFSCMTGVSKDVLRSIQEGALSAKAKYFLTMVAIASFGNAGWQKQQHLPDPGVSCHFALSVWAQEHGWSRQSTWRIREQMVDLGILFYEPDSIHPQEGLLRWNLDFSQWQVLDDTYRRQRYARRGAGRPLQTEETELRKSNGLQQAGKSNRLQKKSNGLQTTATPEIKLVTPARVETAQKEVPEGAVRKELRKKEKNTPLSDESADALCASPHEMILHQQRIEDATGKAASTSSYPCSGEADHSTFWPLRQDHEKADLDYYQRVLRERDKERVALLTRLAHERIGVSLEKASYGRIGALAKQCGAALVVKHILLAAANHIDGDPLDYLTKLARGQQRKETAHAARPTAPTSGYQPYSAEEASQLVWNTL